MGKRKEDAGLSGKESSSFLSIQGEKEDTMQEVIAATHAATEDEAKVKITQEVLDHLATFGITADSSEKFDGLVRSLVEARLKDRAVAEESKPKKKAKGEALPPAKQLAVETISGLKDSEDPETRKQNLKVLVSLVKAGVDKLFFLADGADSSSSVEDFTKDLDKYQVTPDNLMYLICDTFQLGKSAGVITFGRKRNSKEKVVETPTTSTEDIPRLEESDNIPF